MSFVRACVGIDEELWPLFLSFASFQEQELQGVFLLPNQFAACCKRAFVILKILITKGNQVKKFLFFFFF